MTPIPGFPDYAMTPDGTVWRMTPSVADNRRGTVPRALTPLKMGGIGHKQSPSVKLSMNGNTSSRTIKSLMRDTFGDR